MKLKLLLSIVLAVFAISCGKKDDQTTTTQQQKDSLKQDTQQQNTQQQNTQQQQNTGQQQNTQQPQINDDGTVKLTDADKKKQEEELKKADAKKKEEEKKKAEEQKKKDEMNKKEDVTKKDDGVDIDFSSIYAKKCVKCHGKDGKGKVEGVPDLTKGETKSKSDKQLISIITNGKKGETEDDEDMPSWKNKLTEDEIKAAARYVKGL